MSDHWWRNAIIYGVDIGSFVDSDGGGVGDIPGLTGRLDDQHGIASRVGKEQARIAPMLPLALRGTPTLYYGDEIGMTDVPIPASRARRPAG